METGRFPTAAFVLAKPVDLVPPVGQQVTVRATGELTMRGTSKQVDVELNVLRGNDSIHVKATVPVVFADFGVPNPSLPGITTEDRGVVEVLLTLSKA